MKKFLIIFGISFIFLNSAKAAEIELGLPAEAVVGQVLTLNVNIDQLKEPANGVSGALIYDPKTIKINKILDGGSVVSLWLKPIEIVLEGRIEFAGITPGGLISGKLFSLELISGTEGLQSVKLQDLKLVLNDGSGSSYMALDQEAKINFINTSTQNTTLALKAKDTTPPLPFTVEIVQDNTLFNNQWFAVFNAYDQDSGIAYYEIAESLVNTRDNLFWVKTQNPYLLKDQHRRSFVFVKAVDREGNETVMAVQPLIKSFNWNNTYFYVIIFIITVLILLIRTKFKKQNVYKI